MTYHYKKTRIFYCINIMNIIYIYMVWTVVILFDASIVKENKNMIYEKIHC